MATSSADQAKRIGPFASGKQAHMQAFSLAEPATSRPRQRPSTRDGGSGLNVVPHSATSALFSFQRERSRTITSLSDSELTNPTTANIRKQSSTGVIKTAFLATGTTAGANGVRFAVPRKRDSKLLAYPTLNLPSRVPRETDAPFGNGIIEEKKSDQNILQSLPSNVALKLDWPLDVDGFNHARTSEKRSGFSKVPTSSLPAPLAVTAAANKASLVYYRRYIDMDEVDDSITGTVKLEKTAEAKPGRVVLRVVCDKPCWNTASKRYESPLYFGVGRTGPIIWESRPSTPKNKRQRESIWTLHQTDSTFRTVVRQEDLEGLVHSALYTDGQVFTSLANLDVRIHIECLRKKIEVCYFDHNDELGALHIDTRPVGSAYRKVDQQQIDLGFLIAFFETINAMRDESAGAGKGRRDEYGRLVAGHRSNPFVKTLNRAHLNR